jgi:two-component system, NarL family, nitrate/nitrite response regulator NarL
VALMETPSVLLWVAVRIYRDGLAEALASDPRIGRMTVTDAADTCWEVAERTHPRVAVIDACSPLAVDVACELRHAGVGVVALGVAECEADVVALAEVGVSAYLTQEQPLEELIGAIGAVARGEAGCSPRITALLLRHVASGAARGHRPRTEVVRLTRREREILELVARGLTNKEIGLELSIELATVKNHVHHVLEKVGARSRAEAVALTRGARPAVAVDLVGI